MFFYPEGRKALLFSRERDNIKYGSYFKGEKKNIEIFLLPNRLFLSVIANSQNEILHPVYRFFLNSVKVHTKMDSSTKFISETTLSISDSDQQFKQSVLNILKAADFSIKDIKIEEDEHIFDSIEFSDDIPEKVISDLKKKSFLGHQIYENGIATNEIEYLELKEEESTGTIKMYLDGRFKGIPATSIHEFMERFFHA